MVKYDILYFPLKTALKYQNLGRFGTLAGFWNIKRTS